jgi:hypothetical protein
MFTPHCSGSLHQVKITAQSTSIVGYYKNGKPLLRLLKTAAASRKRAFSPTGFFYPVEFFSDEKPEQ